jgi:pimeloyl-ACP methyl ester carboxylesterase
MRRRRWLSFGLIAILLLLLIGGTAAWQKIKPPEVTAFYDAPAEIPTEPGSLIHWEPIDTPAEASDAQLWRFLYSSTDNNGSPTAVSGVLAVPDGAAPEGGFPLVASAHGMVGAARGCAPSLALFEEDGGLSFWSTQIEPYTDAGYAVVMADYQGSGTAGAASNVVGKVEAQNVLDSVRAAREFPDVSISDETYLWGISQGGHAALFTNALAGAYAPEVVFTATSVLAPAIDLRGVFTELTSATRAERRSVLALIVARAWTDTYPGQTLDSILTPAGKLAVETAVDHLCIPWVGIPSIVLPSDRMIESDAVETWSELIDENTPGAQPAQPPIFIGHGDADDIIPISGSEQYVADLCAAGNSVVFKTYPGATHFTVVTDATQDVIDFYAAIRSGEPPSTCA